MPKLLFIDDEDHIAKAYVKSLVYRGCEVDFCDTADTALLRIDNIYDAVILDLMMPRGGLGATETLDGFITGMAILKKLRENGRHFPAFILTQNDELGIQRLLGHPTVDLAVFGNFTIYYKFKSRPSAFAQEITSKISKTMRAK